MQSLLAAESELKGAFLCFFSDLIFDEIIIDKLLKKKGDYILAVDCKKVLNGTMRIKKIKNQIIDIGNHIDVTIGDGNFIGIAKFSNIGASMLKKYLIYEKKNRDDYYTIAIKHIANDRNTVKFFDCKKYFWKEIDTYKDLYDMRRIIRKKVFKY